MSLRPGNAAALLLFNESIPFFEKRTAVAASLGSIKAVWCLRWETTRSGGYAALKSSDELHDAIEETLDVKAAEWPVELDADTHADICRDVADRAWRMVLDAPDEVASQRVLRMKINDRVLNRMEPVARVERLLRDAIEQRGLQHIVTPWVGGDYRTVERPGMLKLNSPGHRLVALLGRLKSEYGVEIHSLWPAQAKWEKPKLWLAKSALNAVRGAKLAGRTIRDNLIPFPAGAVHAQGKRPRIGFVVGGASPWFHTKALWEASQEQFEPVLIAHDIFRHPTTYRLLKESKAPFVPIDSQLSIPATFKKLAKGLLQKRRLQRTLNDWAGADEPRRRETAEELKADFDCLPELQLYESQLRAAIRKYDLKAVISANVLDSLLSAGAEACRAEGVPKICLQNTTAALIDQPLYADCDVYFAESAAMADYMRRSGARGNVEAVGLPIYDDLIRESQQAERNAIRKQFPELANKRVLSLIGAAENHDYSPLMKPLVEMVKRRDDVGLIIRRHPRSRPSHYERLGRELQAEGRGGRLDNISVSAFLADTDYMVTTVSSTTQSALVMGVRPFCWIPTEWRVYAEEANSLRPEIQNRWNEPEQTVAAIERALDDPQDDQRWRSIWRSFVDRNMTGVDGRACERILRRVQQLVA